MRKLCGNYAEIMQNLCKNDAILRENIIVTNIIQNHANYGNNSTLMSRCIKLLKTLCIDNDWLKQNQNSPLGKLLFKNGYLEKRKNEFHYEFNPNIIFFISVFVYIKFPFCYFPKKYRFFFFLYEIHLIL